MGAPGGSLAFFAGRFNELLQRHDATFNAELAPFVMADPETINNLAKITTEIGQVISDAVRMGPTSDSDVAALLRMAIVNLGLDEHGEEPGHEALRAAIDFLDRRDAQKFQKTKLSP